MEWIIYFGLALLALEQDAIACGLSKTKLNLIGAIIIALFWPVTSILAIISVLKEQSK